MEKVPLLETDQSELLDPLRVHQHLSYQLQQQQFVSYIDDTKLPLFHLELLSYAAAAAIFKMTQPL